MSYDKRLILEGRRYSGDSVNMSRAALASGWDVLRVVDCTYEDDGVSPILYASKLLADVVSEACGVRFDRTPHDWLAGLPERHLKRCVTYYETAPDRWPDHPMFVKCADTKWFPARVYTPEEMPDLGTQMDEDGILVSDPVMFESEFRTFVLDGRVMDISSYMAAGVPTQTENGWLSFPELEAHVVRIVEEIAADPAVDMPRSVVIDLGYIEDLGWAVIEANESWFSGLYACDPVRVLETIEGAVIDTRG